MYIYSKYDKNDDLAVSVHCLDMFLMVLSDLKDPSQSLPWKEEKFTQVAKSSTLCNFFEAHVNFPSTRL